MTQMTSNADGGFTLQPGTYAIGGIVDDDGMLFLDHPDADFEFYPKAIDEARLEIDHQDTGIDLLMLPIGPDRFGVFDRTIRIGGYGIVGGAALYVSPADVPESRSSAFYAGATTADMCAYLTFDEPVRVDMDGRTLRIGDVRIDLDRPGCFDLFGTVVDMDEPGLAEALGYGPASDFDEHGLCLRDDEQGPALLSLGTPTALSIAAKLDEDEFATLLYSRGYAGQPA